MGTIADRLNAVKQVKTDIKNAIADKGLYMEDVPFTEYAGKVAMIGATEIKPLEVTENGIYKADEGIAFRPVTVNVPIPKVIPFTFNENGVYDVAVAATVKYGETFTLEYQIDFNAFTQAIEDRGIQLGEVFIADGDNYTLTYDSITFKVFGSNLPTNRQTMVLRKDGNIYAYITHENSDHDAWYVIREEYIAPATGMKITLPAIDDGETHTVRHTDIINEFVFTKSITEQGIAGANPITVDVKPNPVPLTVTENGVYENEQGFSPVTVNTPFQKTSGSFTRGGGYNFTPFAHGLPKPPKLVICFFKGYETYKGVYVGGFIYSEKIATLYRFNSTTEPNMGAATVTKPNAIPAYGAVSVDADNVYVSSASIQWTAGDYEWEAYTW
jgi:hypothetical protein